jgi:hypothetical protein
VGRLPLSARLPAFAIKSPFTVEEGHQDRHPTHPKRRASLSCLLELRALNPHRFHPHRLMRRRLLHHRRLTQRPLQSHHRHHHRISLPPLLQRTTRPNLSNRQILLPTKAPNRHNLTNLVNLLLNPQTKKPLQNPQNQFQNLFRQNQFQSRPRPNQFRLPRPRKCRRRRPRASGFRWT